MKWVHVNAEAAGIGGATIAALRIHRVLLAHGEDSIFACWDKPYADKSALLRRNVWRMALKAFSHVVLRIVSGGNHSTGLIPSGMAAFVNKMCPDAVILHWLQMDTMSIAEISKLAAKRIFWFHHDLWPIRGLTAHEWFPVPKRLGWLDRYVKRNKREIVCKTGRRLVPVCSSKWVASEIQKSGMFANKPEVIPLPIDPVFSKGTRVNGGKFHILNGARGGFSSGLKGGDRLLAAFRKIPQAEKSDMELVVFGEDGAEKDVEGVHVRFAGKLHGESLAQAYRDADLFAFPSRQETFGQTKLEALFCGTPVAVFDETACAEWIEHKKTGWVSTRDDIDDYAEGIRWFYRHWKEGNPIRVKGFDAEKHNAAVVEMWRSLMDGASDE